MAEDDAQIGHGTIIRYSDMAGTPVFTAFARAMSANIGKKKDFIESTTFDSPGKTREYIANLKDTDSFTVKMRYLPNETGQLQIESDYDDDTLRDYQVVFAQPTPGAGAKKRIVFAAYVEAIGVAAQSPDNLVEQDVTFKISGPVTPEDDA